MTVPKLSDDGLATVTVCSRLIGGDKGAGAPLTTREWNELAVTIAASPWKRPGGLLGRTATELQSTLGLDEAIAERLAGLLDRAGLVSLELERLQHRGIWVMVRMDERYPRRWKERLGSQVPPVLFGAGSTELLNREGVAVVGSRDVDEAGSAFAEEVGRRCARGGEMVVSGGARGVDRLALAGALEVEGVGVAVLADSLDRLARGAENRRYVAEGRLTLVSPFHPGAGFQVGNAMARNRLVYCLADYAIVVASSLQTGGTWQGAIENLRHGWVPLFVRAGRDVSAGNRALIDKGGRGLDALPNDRALREVLREYSAVPEGRPEVAAQLALLSD